MPIVTITGATLGTATLAFNEEDDEGSTELTESFPEAHGVECVSVVQFADARGHPELVVASQNGEHAPVGSDTLTRHRFGNPA